MWVLLVVVDTLRDASCQDTCCAWALSVTFLDKVRELGRSDDLVRGAKVVRSPSFLT